MSNLIQFQYIRCLRFITSCSLGIKMSDRIGEFQPALFHDPTDSATTDLKRTLG
ncbi:hypothetical protein HMPREF9517_00272 [Enterococcus faecalis TX1341]|nr:hypothetical protein HMPREF0348_0544 [Enterococcus faecalis TX0104]EFU13115.1 hypothetical protein HMPREF9517_00272 [Enterococcus faecalis TX1341]